MNELLKIRDLEVRYPGFTLHRLSLALAEGEILTVVGESGSGKTTLVKAAACLLGGEAQVSGRVEFQGKELLSMPEKERKKLRMTGFAVAFQNTAEALNPSMTLRGQLGEVLAKKLPPKEREGRMRALMEEVGLKAGDLALYPRQLSGGMVQKFLLACAVALDPRLILLDEPTGSLDSAATGDFIALVRRLNRERRPAFLIVTHDMALAEGLSERMLVLYEGHVMEQGKTRALFDRPRHPYTRGLLNASISLNLAKDIWGIPAPSREAGREACPFYGRCTQAVDLCATRPPELKELPDGRSLACHRGGIVKVLEARDLEKSYGTRRVLSGCELEIYSGEVLSLIGRSGAGKTTLARILGGFDSGGTRGQVLFEGERADFARLHRSKGGVQMVFQDSEGAFNPRMTVREALSEPLLLAGAPAEELKLSGERALRDVGLPAGDFLDKRVRALSGGQKQRLALARALTMEPKLLIADEPTSMLDPSSRANVLRLLKSLQNSRGFTMLMVTHDLGSAVKISDSVYLLKEGRLERILPSEHVRSDLDTLL